MYRNQSNGRISLSETGKIDWNQYRMCVERSKSDNWVKIYFPTIGYSPCGEGLTETCALINLGIAMQVFELLLPAGYIAPEPNGFDLRAAKPSNPNSLTTKNRIR